MTMTRIEALSLAIEALSTNTEAVEVLTKMSESIKNHNTNRTPNPHVAENAAVKTAIVERMTGAEPTTCTKIAEMMGLTISRTSSLLTALVAEGRMNRNVVKRVALFSVPAPVEG